MSKLRYFLREKYRYHIERIKTFKYMMKGVVYGKNTTILSCNVGKYCRFGYDNLIYCSTIGDYTYSAANTRIYYSRIGRFCSISWSVTIGGFEHPVKRISSHGFSYSPIYDFVDKKPESIVNTIQECIIGNDVWIGCNAYLKAGIKVGNGAVIGAGSVVTDDVPPYAIVAGNPAVIIKYRFSKDIVKVLQDTRWWEWPNKKIKKYIVLFQNDVDDVEVLREFVKY